jgi:hypothetical protein
MKHMLRLALVSVLLGFACRAQAIVLTADGSVTMKFTASFAGADTSSGKTNATATVTNIVSTEKVATSNLMVGNAQLLSMLANSYNTTWPSGAALKFANGASFVVAVGSNVVMDVSSVLTLNSSNSIITGQETITQTTSPSGSSTTIKESINYLIPAGLVYDDSAQTPTDGKTIRFTASGYASATVSASGPSFGPSKVIVNFTGAGAGSVSNSVTITDFVIHGGFVGSFTQSGS